MMLSIVAVVSRPNQTIGRYHKVQCRSLVEINSSPWTTPSSQPSSARLFPTSLCWTRLLHCRPALTPCLAASRSMLRTRLSSSSATNERRRQTTVCGSPPPRSTTKVCDASFRICDPFRYSGRRSPAGRPFRPMRQISRRRRCAPASSLSPGILESARCRGRGGLQDQVPRRHRGLLRERRHPREPRKVGCGREQLGSKESITSCLRTKQELVSGDSHGACAGAWVASLPLGQSGVGHFDLRH